MGMDASSAPQFFKPSGLQAPGSPQKPGPFVRSMLGKQVLSDKTSSPAPSFSGGRRDVENLYLSSSHVEVEKRCTQSPGAIYNTPSAFDKQVETMKSTGRSFTMATNEARTKSLVRETGAPGPGTYNVAPGAIGSQPLSSKFTGPMCSFSPVKEPNHKLYLTSAHIERELKGTQGVDPGTYPAPSSLGAQALSTHRSGMATSWAASKEQRGRGLFGSRRDRRQSMPAVGSYEALPSIGKQPLSNFKTSPACGFGRGSTWDQEHKRFLSTGHTQHLKGRENPSRYYDHQTAKTLTTFGKQVLSDRPYSTPASFGGTAPRSVFSKVPSTPGPGTYSV